MFLDNILSGRYVPEIAISQTEKNGRYEIIDGQQRLGSIRNFVNGNIALDRSGNIKYKSLPKDLKREFQVKDRISIVIIKKPRERDLRNLYVTMNSGVAINSMEMRHARGGKLTEYLEELESRYSNLLNNFHFTGKRYNRRDALLKIVNFERGLFEEKKIVGNGHAYLDKTIDTYTKEIESTVIEKTELTLDTMAKMVITKMPLGKSAFLDMYMATSLDITNKGLQFKSDQAAQRFGSWMTVTLQKLRYSDIEYNKAISSSTLAAKSCELRYKKITGRIKVYVSNNKRDFKKLK